MGKVGRSEIESPEDRRKAARAVTFRSSSFTELSGEPRRCQGKVVDVSPSGFQMKSRAQVPIGSMIELEIAPRHDDPEGETLFTCAKVVWSNPLSTGEVAMGLKNIPSDVLDSMGVKSYRSSLDVVASPHTPDGEAPSVPEDMTYLQFRDAAQDRLRNRRPIWPYVVALLMLLMMLWFLLQGPAVISSVTPHGALPFIQGPEPEMAPAALLEGAGGPDTTITHTTIPKWLDRGHDLLSLGHTDEAIALFGALLDSGIAEGPMAGMALAGLVAALEGAGRPAEAAAALAGGRAALEEHLPEAWYDVLDKIQTRSAAGFGNVLLPAFELAAAGDGEVHSERLQNAQSTRDAGHVTPAGPESDPEIWLEVSLSEHVLRVRQGKDLLAAFPIGTGGLARTPVGTFRIVNRIIDPAWYNKGTTVPAGDASNPLGSRWMGLGHDGGAIPYGIHGTNDPHSIGGSSSAGCLRMYPADVERLFEWCQVGDLVRIS